MVLLLALTSCGDSVAANEVVVVAGVSLLGGGSASRDDHLIELVVHDDHVYVANSNRAVAAMRLEPDGGLSLTEEGMVEGALIRCTSLAVHAPSDTLYCGTDEPFDSPDPTIERYDISTPGSLRRRAPFAVERWGTRDVEVMGDYLVLNHFDGGLWVADIDARGELSQLRDTGVEGNARVSVALGARVVTLMADVEGQGAQLRLLDPGTWSGEWLEVDRLALSGPALGLSADASGGSTVAVGLGSGGMAIVDVVDDALIVRRMFEPPAVVTSGLIDGDVAAAVTLSGVFVWSLRQPEPRLLGFGAAGRLGNERIGNMLHGVFHEGELLTSDWVYAERWAVDPEGENLELDVPRGIYVGFEGPIRWRMRNPGEQPLRAELWIDGELEFAAMVPAGEVVELEIPAERRARVFPREDPTLHVVVRAYHPEVPSGGTPLSSTSLVVVQRDPKAMMPPATGDSFPPLLLAELDLEQIYSFPSAGGSQTIWIVPDCGMIWPQLEDLAWAVRAGHDLGRGEPVFLTDFDLRQHFVGQWGLDGVRVGVWGQHAPAEVQEANALDGADLYMTRFFIQNMPGDAMPTDYVVADDGMIRSIERMYRGPWTLAVPWPWD